MESGWVIFLILAIVGFAFFSIELGSWDRVIYRPGSNYSDLVITFWPNIHFIKASIANYHQLPLWRTLIFSGSPIDGDPQAGLWYLPNLLFLILPITIGFNIIFWGHFLFAGMGMWLWARNVGLSIYGSLLAMLAYAFSPKAIAHLGFGHVGLYYAVAYIPWAFYAISKAGNGSARHLYLYCLIIGFQIIANPQLAVYTAIASIVFGCVVLLKRLRGSQIILRVFKSFGLIMLSGVISLLVACVLIIPMLRYAPLSGRHGMSLEETSISALPYNYLIGTLIADHNGYMEYMVYFGVVVLLYGLFALRKANGRIGWLMVLGLFLFSMGDQTPFYGTLYSLFPPLGWLRSPARILFLASALMAILAGMGFDRLAEGFTRSGKIQINLILGAIGWGGFSLLVGYWVLVGKPPANIAVFGIITPLIALLAILQNSQKISHSRAVLLVSILVLADLWLVDRTLIEGRRESEVFGDSPIVLTLLERKQELPFRVYSPSYSIPRQIGAIYGIECADGVDPLYLRDYDIFMQTASGVLRSRYEVTIPAMEGEEEVAVVNREAIPNLKLLGFLNVKYLASEFPLMQEGLKEAGSWSGTWLYENNHYLPRAYLVSQVIRVDDLQQALEYLPIIDPEHLAVVESDSVFHLDDLDGGTVDLLENTPNRIVYRVVSQGSAFLVLSQVYYPGWIATVNNQPVDIIKTNGVLSGVSLAAGENVVEFVYRPWLTWLAVGISVLAISGLLIAVIVNTPGTFTRWLF